jgi:hypothetical protein
MYWIVLVQNNVKWRSPMNMEMKAEYCWMSCATNSFSTSLLHGVKTYSVLWISLTSVQYRLHRNIDTIA